MAGGLFRTIPYAFCAAFALSACNNTDSIEDFDSGPSGQDQDALASAPDSGTPGNSDDSGVSGHPDAAPFDSGVQGTDAGNDSGVHDTGVHMDATTGQDAQTQDAQGGMDATTPDSGPTDSGTSNCIPGVVANCSGHHRAGQDCAGCHDFLGSTLHWTLAGTLYMGGSALAGATIEAIDANGQKVDMQTCSNGNFYTLQSVTFPVTVRASDCPNDHAMVASLSSSQGSCNNCHGGSTALISLP
jgi:hypothetical protein